MYFNNINNLQAKIKKFIYIFLLHFINRYKEIHKKKKALYFSQVYVEVYLKKYA